MTVEELNTFLNDNDIEYKTSGTVYGYNAFFVIPYSNLENFALFVKDFIENNNSVLQMQIQTSGIIVEVTLICNFYNINTNQII